jgi:hypothetical protein
MKLDNGDKVDVKGPRINLTRNLQSSLLRSRREKTSLCSETDPAYLSGPAGEDNKEGARG